MVKIIARISAKADAHMAMPHLAAAIANAASWLAQPPRMPRFTPLA